MTDAVEVIEETVETLERIPKVHLNGTTKKQQIVILTTTAVVSAVAGGGVSYLFTKKLLTLKYEKIIQEEVQKARSFHRILAKDGVDPEDLAAKYPDQVNAEPEHPLANDYAQDDRAVVEAVEAVKSYQPTPSQRRPEDEAKVEEDAEVVVNIFNETPPSTHWDYEKELDARKNGGTYIITDQEFIENEPEYEQDTLTYYASDETLADDMNDPIKDIDATIGLINLQRFGHGSRDENVVHIRNERLNTDFEVILSEGSFVYEVLGLDAELKHSDSGHGKVPRFRHDE